MKEELCKEELIALACLAAIVANRPELLDIQDCEREARAETIRAYVQKSMRLYSQILIDVHALSKHDVV